MSADYHDCCQHDISTAYNYEANLFYISSIWVLVQAPFPPSRVQTVAGEWPAERPTCN